MKRVKKGISWVLILSMLALLTSCQSPEKAKEQVVKEQTVSPNSKWINSNIIGAIDENTEVRLQDDFHTAVNKDWIINAKEDDDRLVKNNADLVYERTKAILHGGTTEDAKHYEIPKLSDAMVQHDEELVEKLSQLLGDWEERNRLGAEPLRPYMEAIESIQTVEEMTAYLKGERGKKLLTMLPIELTVDTLINQNETYSVQILSTHSTLLGSSGSVTTPYLVFSGGQGENIEAVRERILPILKQLGYTEGDVDRWIRDCLHYESRIAQLQSDNVDQENYYSPDTFEYFSKEATELSLSELQELAGDYPMTELLAANGLDTVGSYAVMDPDYVREAAKLYRDDILSELKAYYLVHTVFQTTSLLDRAALERNLPDNMKTMDEEGNPVEPDPEAKLTPEKLEEMLLQQTVQAFLNEPLCQVYISRYCDPQLRAEIYEMVDAMRDEYQRMLLEEDWLSEETRQKTVEKLDAMVIRVMYGETFQDYTSLNLSDAENLVDAAATITAFQTKKMYQRAGQPVNREDWDMSVANGGTTTVNAGYLTWENSICVYAGILADGESYPAGGSYEEKLGRLGSVIGHEISHAFDANGSTFDKYGHRVDWWDREDREAYDRRISRLKNYYNSLSSYPHSSSWQLGELVNGEATADMGGIKVCLRMAEQESDFDYDAFFRIFAGNWAACYTYETEVQNAQDPHPVGFLRTNVTLQQFEKFYETYDVQPEDGMYLSPESRVAVW